jgi:hypothetical protein
MKAFKRFLILYLIVGVTLCVSKYDNYNVGEIVQIIVVGPPIIMIYAIMFLILIVAQTIAGVSIDFEGIPYEPNYFEPAERPKPA